MITIFSIPKPFEGHFGVIQRNAIGSWVRLDPRPQVILFGDEAGTAEAAAEFGTEHVPRVACNEYGTQIVSDVFRQAEARARFDWLCYINADIVLLSDFMEALRTARTCGRKMVLTGRRTDVDITIPIDFSSPDWEQAARAQAESRGDRSKCLGVDYVVFEKGQYADMPPFAVGRTSYDNWMIWATLRKRVPLVDATSRILAIHQNHWYTYVGAGDMWKAPEVRRNVQLGGSACRWIYIFADANYRLTSRGIVYRPGRAMLNRCWVAWLLARRWGRAQARKAVCALVGEKRTAMLSGCVRRLLARRQNPPSAAS